MSTGATIETTDINASDVRSKINIHTINIMLCKMLNEISHIISFLVGSDNVYIYIN